MNELSLKKLHVGELTAQGKDVDVATLPQATTQVQLHNW